MKRSLSGIFVPVVTPFSDGGGDVDLAAFVANVRAHRVAGISGVVLAGSNGEAPLLEEKERRSLIAAAREQIPEREWLIAGTGSESTRQCVARCRDAAENGADAVMVVAPHYFGPAMTSEALEAHYVAVADASPVPVVLYNIPKYAHFALAADLVGRLAEHRNIVGIKDSSGDVSQLKGYLTSQSETFSVLTGSGATLLQALHSGARGGVLAVALFAAPLVKDVFEAFAAGDAHAASSAQQTLMPLATEIVGTLGVAGVKAALDLVGLAGGAVRSPLLALSDERRAHVGHLMQEAGQAAVA